jgi:hypothetical protein
MTQRNDTPVSGSPSLSPPGAPADPAAIQAAPPPAGSTGIKTASDPADPDRISLPPAAAEPKRIVDPAKARRRAWVLDGIQVLLVLALAFLSASFPIRNSDLFLHMGTGKLLVEGKYTFGTDPFSVNPPDAAWVNHSWLFDVGSYGLFSATDAEGLVLFKAMLVVALACVMLLIRRAGQPLWVPAVCTALALLAISTRMLFQPLVLSYVFLALTLFILTLRSTHPAVTGKNGEKPSFLARFGAWPYRLYTLPILFALWANFDAWFILGPVVVGLYLLGELLQESLSPVPRGPDAPVAGEGRRMILVLILGVAACLLNPHHYHVFAIPTEISPTLAPEIRGDKQLEQMFWSPWQGEYFSRAGLSHSVADMAYYPLLVLSFLSFLANLGSWRWGRGLIWAAFAALSAYHARSIPLFAIIAGPIMALNFQDAVLARQMGKRPALMPAKTSAWPLAGRVLSALLLAILVAAAWPGWLHGFPDDPVAERHRVGFNLDADAALVETAQQLARWRQEGKITGEQNAFNVHPDAANYLAFYCPEEKTFFDYRFRQFKDSAATYYQMRNELSPQRGAGGSDAPPRGKAGVDWRQEFRARKVRHLLVYDPDPFRTFPAIKLIHDVTHQQEKDYLQGKKSPQEGKQPAAYAREWTLIDQRGRVALFAWSDPERAWDDSLRALELKPNQRAFGPNAARAPGASAGRGPATADDDTFLNFQEWWEKFADRRLPRAPDSYEAGYHFYMSMVETQQARNDLSTKHAEQIAAAIGFGADARTLPGEILFRITHWGQALIGPTEKFGSTASTLLAIRAARRALAANPFDDAAYFWLGIAYQQLPEASNPYDLYAPESLLGEIRRCQISGCLYNAAKIKPDRLEVHQSLANLYLVQGFQDLGLQQRKEELRLTEELGPNIGEDIEVYRQRLTYLRDQVKQLDDQVKNAQNDFLIATKNLPKAVLKAELARKRGLTGEALDLLVKTSPVELGADGLLMELQLLLAVGRVEDVRANWNQDLIDNTMIAIVGSYQLPIYKWLVVLQAMSVGDYDKADEALAQIIAAVERIHRVVLPGGSAPGICAQLSLDFLDPTGLRPLTWQCFQRYDRLLKLQQLKRVPLSSPAQSELHVLRGLLALEVGDSQRAADQFRTGLNLSWPPRRYVPYLSILGTSNPLEAAAAAAEGLEVAQGVILPLPSRWLAVEYLRLIEQAAKSPNDGP